MEALIIILSSVIAIKTVAPIMVSATFFICCVMFASFIYSQTKVVQVTPDDVVEVVYEERDKDWFTTDERIFHDLMNFHFNNSERVYQRDFSNVSVLETKVLSNGSRHTRFKYYDAEVYSFTPKHLEGDEYLAHWFLNKQAEKLPRKRV